MADSAAIDRVVKSLHWLGHDAFRLDSSIGPIYFDPFQIEPGPKAALIFASHDHFDHCVPEEVAKVLEPETVIVTEALCAAKLGSQARVMKPGEIIDLKGVAVKAVSAYNTDKQFHPKDQAWLGFLVTVDGVTIYHAGDTDHIPEMADLGQVDIALLPVSGTYVMTAAQAAEAAKIIKPGLAIPMHYGAIVGGDPDAQSFAQALVGVVPVKILPKE